jgi:hypothetical protein
VRRVLVAGIKAIKCRGADDAPVRLDSNDPAHASRFGAADQCGTTNNDRLGPRLRLPRALSDYGRLCDPAIRWSTSVRVNDVVSTAPLVHASPGRCDARRATAHLNHTDRCLGDAWNLDANLGLRSASILDRDVAIAINEATLPCRDLSGCNHGIQEAGEERGGTIGNPTLPYAIKVKVKTLWPMEKSAAEVDVVFMLPMLEI